MKKTLFILLLIGLPATALFAQRFRCGLSFGATAAFPQVTRENAFGKLRPRAGGNFCVTVSCRLRQQLFLEGGAGYFVNYYKVLYDDMLFVHATGSPFFPLKLAFAKPLGTGNLILAAGAAVQTAFAKGKFTSGITDSTSMTAIRQEISVKTFPLAHLELGYRKTNEKNRIHQLSLQFFYGLLKQIEGEAYHLAAPGDAFRYVSRNHFTSLQYTFWFGRKNAEGMNVI